MNARSVDVERLLSGFLVDESVARAPDRILTAVSERVDQTPQRHGWTTRWQVPHWSPQLRLATSALVVVAIVALAVQAIGPLPSTTGTLPTAQPTATPAPTGPPPTLLPESSLTTVVSKQYAYTISVPVGWGVRAASRVLGVAEPPWADGDAIDDLGPGALPPSGTPEGSIIVGAAPLAPATTLDSWTRGVLVPTCGQPTAVVDLTVDGEPARMSTYASCYDGFHQWVTVLHEGWGWHIVWLNEPGTESADATYFGQLLPTFRFPAEPPAAPPPSATASTP